MTNSLKRLINTERQLAEANTRVKYERLSAIGELAASLAHDLKNPLGTIKSSAEILRRTKKESDPELDHVLARMDRAIER
ncbi:MAG: histidine kinase, partial [Nitrosopumilaceae archaeon]|nr:histidine kinase [Nitrosopumilaceae archaeon]